MKKVLFLAIVLVWVFAFVTSAFAATYSRSYTVTARSALGAMCAQDVSYSWRVNDRGQAYWVSRSSSGRSVGLGNVSIYGIKYWYKGLSANSSSGDGSTSLSSTHTGKFIFGGDFTCGPVTIHDLEVWRTYVTARSSIQGSGDTVSHSHSNTFSSWFATLGDPVIKAALSAYIPFYTTLRVN